MNAAIRKKNLLGLGVFYFSTIQSNVDIKLIEVSR